MIEKLEGEVKWFNNERGYGFIHPVFEDDTVDASTEYFVHYTSVMVEGFKTLQPNQRVYFSIKETDKGDQAIDVEPIE